MYFRMMHNILLQALTLNLSWKKSRIECFVGMIISLIENCSVSTKNMALGIRGNAKHSSKTQRTYRFLKDQPFNYDAIAKFILSIFCCNEYIISLDRTCWKFGKKDINILFMVIVFGKISVPIYWHQLNHGGACDSALMKEMMIRFINQFGANSIKYLLADREFISKEWLDFLIERQINFAIPLRKDMKIRIKKSLQTKAIGQSFKHLQQFEYVEVEAVLWSHVVRLSAYRNHKNEVMVVAANSRIDVNIFALYKFRWSIERLFKHLKSAGFDIEKSHIYQSDRFMKLVAVCAIASAIIIKNGLIQNQLNPIKIRTKKTNPKQLVSFFTYGLDHIKNCLKQAKYKAQRVLKRILDYDSSIDFNFYFPQLLHKL